MRARRLLFVLASLLAFGCGGGSSEPPAPLEWTWSAADVEFSLIANGVSQRQVFATFAVGANTGLICTHESVAGCDVETCTRGGEVVAGTIVDPGSVTVSSASFGDAAPMVIDANGSGSIVQIGELPAGEEVRFVATGSASFPRVGATVKAAGAVELKSLGTCAAQATDAPCRLAEDAPTAAWSGVSKFVLVSLSGTLDVPSWTRLRCMFDGAPGTGQIPAAALARLPRLEHYALTVTGYEAPATVATGATTSVAVVSMRLPSRPMQWVLLTE